MKRGRGESGEKRMTTADNGSCNSLPSFDLAGSVGL